MRRLGFIFFSTDRASSWFSRGVQKRCSLIPGRWVLRTGTGTGPFTNIRSRTIGRREPMSRSLFPLKVLMLLIRRRPAIRRRRLCSLSGTAGQTLKHCTNCRFSHTTPTTRSGVRTGAYILAAIARSPCIAQAVGSAAAHGTTISPITTIRLLRGRPSGTGMLGSSAG